MELSHNISVATGNERPLSARRREAIARGRRARAFGRRELATELAGVRSQLRAWVAELPETAFVPPMRSTINPPLWEAAHVAWFAEWWCVRDAYNVDDGSRFGGTLAKRDSIWIDCDAFLNSNVISHQARWHLPQVTRATVLGYLDRSLEATLLRLEQTDETDAGLYPFRLSLFHEAMHLEALAWCAQTLGWKRPAWVRELLPQATPETAGEFYECSARIGFKLGFTHDDAGFSFDNERGAQMIDLSPFSIARALVTQAEFAAFVDSGEYVRRTGLPQPRYWRRSPTGWQRRSFDQWQSLTLDAPMVHVSAQEAQAYCDWLGMRLPSEAQLALAQREDAIEWGTSVWEWTCDAFAPYSGFVADRYREYSAPWFDGGFRVLRGGSYAALDVLHHSRYRNFFAPDRSDVFAGFRVCKRS